MSLSPTHIQIFEQIRGSQWQKSKEKMLLKFFIFGIAMTSAITGSFRILFFPGNKKLNTYISWNTIAYSLFRPQEVSARWLKCSLK